MTAEAPHVLQPGHVRDASVAARPGEWPYVPAAPDRDEPADPSTQAWPLQSGGRYTQEGLLSVSPVLFARLQELVLQLQAAFRSRPTSVAATPSLPAAAAPAAASSLPAAAAPAVVVGAVAAGGPAEPRLEPGAGAARVAARDRGDELGPMSDRAMDLMGLEGEVRRGRGRLSQLDDGALYLSGYDADGVSELFRTEPRPQPAAPHSDWLELEAAVEEQHRLYSEVLRPFVAAELLAHAGLRSDVEALGDRVVCPELGSLPGL